MAEERKRQIVKDVVRMELEAEEQKRYVESIKKSMKELPRKKYN